MASATRELARIPGYASDDACATYILPFGHKCYHVPAENVMVYPKYPNHVRSDRIADTIHSRSPLRWRPLLTHGRVMRIRGVEGNCLYATFNPGGHDPQEQRILRQIPPCVFEACRAQVRAWAQCEVIDPDNARHVARFAIYDWTVATDLPHHACLSPVRNGWPEAELAFTPEVRLPPPPRGQRVAPPDPMREFEELRELSRVEAPPRLRWHSPVSNDVQSTRPSRAPRADRETDMRTLSDFLFACQTHVAEGAYLEASNALKRVWDAL
jgi:hypothetical protein